MCAAAAQPIYGRAIFDPRDAWQHWPGIDLYVQRDNDTCSISVWKAYLRLMTSCQREQTLKRQKCSAALSHAKQSLSLSSARLHMPGIGSRKKIMMGICMPAGGRHALTYDLLKERFSHVAPSKLQTILREALQRKQAEFGQGVTSLLHRGAAACTIL